MRWPLVGLQALAAGVVGTSPAAAAGATPLRLDLSTAQQRPIDALSGVRAPLLIAAGTQRLRKPPA